MNIKNRNARNIEIIKYLFEGNTLFNAAIHFDLSINQTYRVNWQLRLKIAKKVVNDGISIREVADEYGIPAELVSIAAKEYISGKLKEAKETNES